MTIKWRNTNDKKSYNFDDGVKEPKIDNDSDFKRAAKKFHPDLSDPFLKSVNEKKMQKLIETREKLKND
jgi:hypothetical protein